METSNQKFHFLSQLPAEAIWRECLLNRVVEIDYPWEEGVVWGPYSLCKLRQTTIINRRPPVISRVCRESRYIASKFNTSYDREKGSPSLEAPPDAQWNSDLQLEKSWIDPSRDIIHLNWTSYYTAGYFGDGSALDFLAWRAVQASGGSFMFDILIIHSMEISM
ncbi:hypothetical protein PENSUB_11657 [Penicillium subrubescens]|uniref:2EXR domain-containing protein n=1 Tax=Penicillium subrubescens TaxID=1316194 RepID=A0A1Q5T2C5_9EURO|nr:hypothetical protein PENSUB_11657 [Penicillium subrubescens]